MEQEMAKHKVVFQPVGAKIEVEGESNLLEAAAESGIYLNSLCGGEGVCGKCKVQITLGEARPTSQSIRFLSREEINSGFVLGCQTEVRGDLEVWVPPEARLEEEQILTTESMVCYQSPQDLEVKDTLDIPSLLYMPVTQKIYLSLPKPSLTDNLADLDRLYREIRKKIQAVTLEISLPALRNMPRMLRENQWQVTATLYPIDEHCIEILSLEPGDTCAENYGIACDIGTTTIVAQLVDLRSGAILGVEASHNQQARYGEDVISRMIYACSRGGLSPIHGAVVETVNTSAAELNLHLHPNARVTCMPGVSSYVGGDITAGVLASGISNSAQISALIDVGTNGEIVIGNNEWLVCCSASAGPAFEGSGTKCGMRATRGAIQKVHIDSEKVHYQTVGGAKVRGICGSGLIDAIAELFRNRIIDAAGKFPRDSANPRVQENEGDMEFVLAHGDETETGKSVVITESDISNLIKSKGAILAAMRLLLNSVGMSFKDLERILVAGGFGNHLDVENAIFIGLLPDLPPERVKFIGNSSLTGARMALLSRHALARANTLARQMTYFELSVDPKFYDEFVAALFLPHTDMDLYPSVKRVMGS
jgi:uncharacterized 2Fe-2S/4Fe-4S cluster protein (DUF4445 family)